MPRGDRTGPDGQGAGTGRTAGYCAGHGMPGYLNPVGRRGYGRGFGMGFGRGGDWGHGRRGRRNRFYAAGVSGWMGGGAPLDAVPEQELAGLKQQAEYLGKTLDEIRGRIRELEANPKES